MWSTKLWHFTINVWFLVTSFCIWLLKNNFLTIIQNLEIILHPLADFVFTIDLKLQNTLKFTHTGLMDYVRHGKIQGREL